MNNHQDIALAAAQRFDPSCKCQQRSKWITLVLEYLGEDELPEAGIFALRGRAIGFFWLTNKRLLYAGRDEGSLFKGSVFLYHSYNKISSIQVVSKRAALSMITIRIGDDAIEFGITPTTVRSEEFVALVRKKISIATEVATGS